MHIARVELGYDGLRRVIHFSFCDAYPERIELWIVELQIRGVEPDQLGIVGIVEEQPREVVPIGLEDALSRGCVLH